MTTTRSTILCAAMAVLAAGCGARDGGTPAESDPQEATPAMRTLTLDDQTLHVETLFEDDFSGDLSAWLAEGTPRVEVRNGRLSVDAVLGEPHVGTVWCRQEFQGDQAIEYTARIEPTLDAKGHGETNLNFFLFASDPSGKSLLDTAAERTGAYREYHSLRNYIFTYLNSDKNDRSPIHGDHGTLFTRVRFRKDPGFGLLREVWLEPTVEKGRDYRFTIVVQGPRMRFYVDGRKIIDHEDADRPHRRGLHGFRTWMSHLSAGEFRVSRILP